VALLHGSYRWTTVCLTGLCAVWCDVCVLLQIASAVSEVREKGFINYFGLQRFGTGNVPTHRWA